MPFWFIHLFKWYWPLNNNILQGAFGRLDPTGSWTEKLYDVLPVGRLGEIPEIANLATYMVSDYSSWMTGEVRK
jgi:NAD(P)-dependent dehydrogenase (short-subunit alcohol dehydrogenase family)